MGDYLALSEIYLPHKGGHVIWLHEVLRRIGGARVLTRHGPRLERHESLDGVAIHRVNLKRRWYLRPESLTLYAKLTAQGLYDARKMHPSAILAARVMPEGMVATKVARAMKVPSVIFAHGEEITCWSHWPGWRSRRATTTALKRRLMWKTYRQADRIIANSSFTRDLLTTGGIDPARIAVIHPGTDPETFHPQPKDPALIDKLGLHNRKVILTVGRLSQRKGQDMMIRALPIIMEAVPDAVYVLAGQGDYAKTLRDLAAMVGVSDRVRFLSEVPAETLPAVYNLADIFAMPNRQLPDSLDVEGFGIVFLEAGACAKPVIGGQTGGVPDAIAHNQTGLLVDGDSVSDIADAAIKLLTDPDLASRLGNNGRQRVLNELTWQHSADRIQQWIDTPEPTLAIPAP